MPFINCTLTFRNDEEVVYRDERHDPIRSVIRRDQLDIDTANLMNSWVDKYGERCGRQELVILGRHLYRIAFGYDNDENALLPRKAFEETHRYFRERKDKVSDLKLRLRLVFYREALKTARLPWEFLFMPRGEEGFFLAGEDTNLILTRYVKDPQLQDFLRPEDGGEQLRILLVISNPSELDKPLDDDVTAEILALQKENPEGIQVKVEAKPTRDRLSKILSASGDESFRPHILHFIGHGHEGAIALFKSKKELQEEQGAAVLEGRKAKDADWVDAKTFCDLFSEHRPQVVFLQACRSAYASSLATLNSTAMQLVYADIPAVVAMQYEISNVEADLFASAFYRKIRSGMYVDEAVVHARRELGRAIHTGRSAWSDRSFATPVLYLQSEYQVIDKPPVRREPDRQAGCPWGCTALVSRGDESCANCGGLLRICPNCDSIMRNAPNAVCQRKGCGIRFEALKPALAGEDAPHHSPGRLPAVPRSPQEQFGALANVATAVKAEPESLDSLLIRMLRHPATTAAEKAVIETALRTGTYAEVKAAFEVSSENALRQLLGFRLSAAPVRQSELYGSEE